MNGAMCLHLVGTWSPFRDFCFAKDNLSRAGWWGTETDREKLKKKSFSNLKLFQL